MLETDLQMQLGIRGPSEMLMFEEDTYCQWFDQAASDGSRIVEELRSMEIPNFGSDQISVTAVASWATAYSNNGTLSSQITATECIVGKGNWIDTIAYPAKPGSTKPAEAYSQDYTDEQKEAGRQVLFGQLDENEERGGVRLVETNNMITRDDPARNKPLSDFLVKRGYTECMEIAGKNLHSTSSTTMPPQFCCTVL